MRTSIIEPTGWDCAGLVPDPLRGPEKLSTQESFQSRVSQSHCLQECGHILLLYVSLSEVYETRVPTQSQDLPWLPICESIGMTCGSTSSLSIQELDHCEHVY